MPWFSGTDYAILRITNTLLVLGICQTLCLFSFILTTFLQSRQFYYDILGEAPESQRSYVIFPIFTGKVWIQHQVCLLPRTVLLTIVLYKQWFSWTETCCIIHQGGNTSYRWEWYLIRLKDSLILYSNVVKNGAILYKLDLWSLWIEFTIASECKSQLPSDWPTCLQWGIIPMCTSVQPSVV